MENKNIKTVALIGRPNVGKSTLFNRLIGKRLAIETEIPGTTRDRLFGEVAWNGEIFELVDVAGIEKGSKKEIDKNIQEGIDIAIKSADLILFVVDWNEKSNDSDKMIARSLRNSDKPVILVINKADNKERIAHIDEFLRLGDFQVEPVSAISGKSSGDLLDAIVRNLQALPALQAQKESRESDIKLAIIGRPNVGKSTLLNTIIGEKRAIVSEEAGTTRDIISVNFNHGGKNIAIVDTAGLRRPGKISHDSIESFSVLRTEKALRDSDIAILLIDAEEGLVALDMNILGKAKEWGKGIVLAVNKIDLIEEEIKEYMAKTLWQLQGKLNFAPWLPVVFISAKDEQNIKALLNQVIKADESRHTVIDQADLDSILEDAKKTNFQLENIKNIRQKKTTPPIFEISYPAKRKPHFSQIRYLENKIRDQFPMVGSPVFIDEISYGKNRSNR